MDPGMWRVLRGRELRWEKHHSGTVAFKGYPVRKGAAGLPEIRSADERQEISGSAEQYRKKGSVGKRVVICPTRGS
jgi:hypothetical protein